MDALLKVPDLQTPMGSRDYALLLFLYNARARAEEATNNGKEPISLVVIFSRPGFEISARHFGSCW
jgi:hypothetical protein